MSLEDVISNLPGAKRYECKLCGTPVISLSDRPADKIPDLTDRQRWTLNTMRNEKLCLNCSVDKYKEFYFGNEEER